MLFSGTDLESYITEYTLGYEDYYHGRDLGERVRNRRDTVEDYRGTTLIKKQTPLVSYSRTMPRALWWS